jgi:hypothetical protein
MHNTADLLRGLVRNENVPLFATPVGLGPPLSAPPPRTCPHDDGKRLAFDGNRNRLIGTQCHPDRQRGPANPKRCLLLGRAKEGRFVFRWRRSELSHQKAVLPVAVDQLRRADVVFAEEILESC